MNPEFAEHVTSQAFALTLSRPMIAELLRIVETTDASGFAAAEGHLTASAGLRRRGLIVFGSATVDEIRAAGGPSRVNFSGDMLVPVILPTLAGRLVAELCRQAGLAPNASEDGVLAALQQRHAQRAEHQRVVAIVEQQQHEDFLASIKLKPKFQQMVDRAKAPTAAGEV